MPRTASILFLAALVAGTWLSRTTPLRTWRGPQQGIAMDAYQARPVQADFDRIADLGASHLAIFTWATMPTHTSPEVVRFAGDTVDWALTDRGILAMGRMARRAGLRTVVLPTLADFVDGHWRGEATMADEASWAAWFESYRTFVLHHADLAERIGAVGFSVGTELRETTHRETQWRETIAMVRERFSGWLTYAANWDDYRAVPWWDALDVVGVQAYFELGTVRADLEDAEIRSRLLAAWQPIAEDLRALGRETDRKILFTEIGYKSHAGSTNFPWEWGIEGPADPRLQHIAYEVAFDVFWDQAWFEGFYWWKWHPATGLAVDRSRDFTPQGKPAEEVLRRRWRTR